MNNGSLLQVCNNPVKLFFVNDLSKIITGSGVISIKCLDAFSMPAPTRLSLMHAPGYNQAPHTFDRYWRIWSSQYAAPLHLYWHRFLLRRAFAAQLKGNRHQLISRQLINNFTGCRTAGIKHMIEPELIHHGRHYRSPVTFYIHDIIF